MVEPSGKESVDENFLKTKGKPNLPPELKELQVKVHRIWNNMDPLVKDLINSLSLHILKQSEFKLRQEEELVRMRAENTELNNKLSIAEGGHDEIHANYMYLKQEVNAVVHHNEKLKWKLKSLEQEQKEINDRLTKALKENFQLRQQLKGSNQNASITQNREEIDLKKKNKELNIRVSELERRLEEKFEREEDSRLIYHAKLTGVPAVDIDLQLIRQLKAENAFLDTKLSEVLTINRRTSNITNILIEMRKQMLKLQNIITDE